MTATYHTRIQRLRRLEAILPRATTLPGECLDISRLLDILGAAYGQGTAASRRRALQREYPCPRASSGFTPRTAAAMPNSLARMRWITPPMARR